MTFIVTAGVSSSTLNNASYAQVVQAAQPANQALLLEPRQVDMYLLDMRIRMQADSGRVHVQAQIGIANAAGKHAKLCILAPIKAAQLCSWCRVWGITFGRAIEALVAEGTYSARKCALRADVINLQA